MLAKLAFRQGQGEPVRSIVVVGTGALSAAGQVAANLGAITARGGRQVVIVDADTAEGPITRIFGLNDRAGLTDELATGGQDLTDALEPVTNTLSIVPRGAAPGEDQLDVSRAKGMLASLSRRADIVIVSTGPLHLSAGALAWAERHGAAVALDAAALAGDDAVAAAIGDLTGGGAHLSIDAVGSHPTCVSSVRCLRRRGRHVQVGLLPAVNGAPPVPMDRVIAFELEIRGSHGMAAHAYPPMLELVTSGALRPDLLVADTMGLAEAATALTTLDRPTVPGIRLIDPRIR